MHDFIFFSISIATHSYETANQESVSGFFPLFYFIEQARTWICKPRYNYAGRGIFILSGNNDLNTVLKFKTGANNRLQYEPRLPGYLMQE